MEKTLTVPRPLKAAGLLPLPAIVTAAGDQASRRFIEFLTANICNPNARAAYWRAILRFCQWCEDNRLQLHRLER